MSGEQVFSSVARRNEKIEQINLAGSFTLPPHIDERGFGCTEPCREYAAL
jgi:hypothetical protein